MNKSVQGAYANIKRNIEVVLNTDSLTLEQKTDVMNIIDTAVYNAIDKNCQLPEWGNSYESNQIKSDRNIVFLFDLNCHNWYSISILKT